MRPSYTIAIFLLLTFWGLFLLPKLPFTWSSKPSQKMLLVSFGLPNAEPLLVEERLTSPLEGLLGQMRGVEKIKSVSGIGSGQIELYLKPQTDPELFRFELVGRLRQIYPLLPQEASFPEVHFSKPEEEQSEAALMTVQIYSQLDNQAFEQFLEQDLLPKLNAVKGLKRSELHGLPVRECVLRYNEAVLHALGLSRQSLQQHLTTLCQAQFFEQGEVRVRLKKAVSLADLNQSVVAERQGRCIKLQDLAQASLRYQAPSAIFRVNAQNAILLNFYANVSQSELRTSEALKRVLASLSRQYTSKFSYHVEADSSEFLAKNIDNQARQFFLALGVLLLFLWLSQRQIWGFITSLVSLVVILGLSALVFYYAQLPINSYSLAALAIALGIMIDNVLLCMSAERQFVPLVGGTVLTCAGLGLVFLLPETMQAVFREFADMLLITLGLSVLVSWWFVPALQGFWPMKLAHNGQTSRLRCYVLLLLLMSNHRKKCLWGLLLAFGTPLFMLPNQLESKHCAAKIYNQIFNNEGFKKHVRPWLNQLTGGTLRLLVQYVYEGSHFGSEAETVVYVQAKLPPRYTLAQLDSTLRRLEWQLLRQKRIKRITCHIPQKSFGYLAIYFQAQDQRGALPFLIKAEATRFAALQTDGISWQIYGVGQGFSDTGEQAKISHYRVQLKGYNYDELQAQAERLKVLLAQHKRVKNVDTQTSLNADGSPLLVYKLSLAPHSPVRTGTLANALHTHTRRTEADFYLWLGKDYLPTRLENTPAKTLYEFQNGVLEQDSAFFAMQEWASLQKSGVPSQILKENQNYVQMLQFDYTGGYDFGQKHLQKCLQIWEEAAPLGFSAKQHSWEWTQAEKVAFYKLLALLMLVLYLLLAFILNAWRAALWLLLSLPLCFIGIFICFYFFDWNFDQGGYAAMLFLCGNVLYGGVFLVHNYQQNVKRASSPIRKILLFKQVVVQKGLILAQSIVSTVASLVPFLLDSQVPFWFAFAVCTALGLLGSVLVLLYALPLLMTIQTATHKY